MVAQVKRNLLSLYKFINQNHWQGQLPKACLVYGFIINKFTGCVFLTLIAENYLEFKRSVCNIQ